MLADGAEPTVGGAGAMRCGQVADALVDMRGDAVIVGVTVGAVHQGGQRDAVIGVRVAEVVDSRGVDDLVRAVEGFAAESAQPFLGYELVGDTAVNRPVVGRPAHDIRAVARPVDRVMPGHVPAAQSRPRRYAHGSMRPWVPPRGAGSDRGRIHPATGIHHVRLGSCHHSSAAATLPAVTFASQLL